MGFFDAIADRLGTSRHTAMVLVLLGVLAGAWYISRHLPAVAAPTTNSTGADNGNGTAHNSADTRMAGNTTANDTTTNAVASTLFGSGVPGYQPPIQPPTPAPPPQQQALNAYGGMYGSSSWNPPTIPPYPYPFGYKPVGR